jgi:uncharacterized membrane protein YbjE (DUF340 family)
MKTSLILLSFFVAGILAGVAGLVPEFIVESDLELYVLYALLFFVGLGLGCDREALRNILRLNLRTLLVPGAVVVGSLAGAAALAWLFTDLKPGESLAVGSGFAYYSLSSVLITQISGEELGVIALLSNIFRESITILLTPVLVRYCGKLSPIACGGATTMDVTLPIIHKFVGSSYTLVAIINGLVLTILVPIMVPLFL